MSDCVQAASTAAEGEGDMLAQADGLLLRERAAARSLEIRRIAWGYGNPLGYRTQRQSNFRTGT